MELSSGKPDGEIGMLLDGDMMSVLWATALIVVVESVVASIGNASSGGDAEIDVPGVLYRYLH